MIAAGYRNLLEDEKQRQVECRRNQFIKWKKALW